MMDEQPIRLKRQPTSSLSDSLVCIVHYDRCRDTEIRPLSSGQYVSICTASQVRQAQTSEGHRLDDICRYIPSQFNESVHGCHRWCFKNFTNIYRLKVGSSDTETPRTSTQLESRRRSSSRTTDTRAHAPLFPQDKCIFCSRHIKRPKEAKEFLTTCVTEVAEHRIKECAVMKNDYRLLGMIQDEDLRAREARYHESCRRDYVRKDSRQHHKSEVSGDAAETVVDLTEVKAAYADAFKQLCDYVQVNIIQLGHVERMSMLRTRYIDYIECHHPQFSNPNYPTQKVKSKLVAHFGNDLQFWLPKASCKSELVYSSNIDIGEAVESAFDASSSDDRLINKAAMLLSNSIHVAFSQSPELPWPPSVQDLEAISPPAMLTEFLCRVIAGPSVPKHKYTSKTMQVAKSVAEDICYAATRGRWVMPKHVQLGLSLHHLTGSAELITLLNRY